MHAVPLRHWGLTVFATSISSLIFEYDVLKLSIELAEGISRVFQRRLIQNYERCERFVSVNGELSQFSPSSPANSLPVHGTLNRQNKGSLGSEKKRVLSFLKLFFYRNWFAKKKKIRVTGPLRTPGYLWPAFSSISISVDCLAKLVITLNSQIKFVLLLAFNHTIFITIQKRLWSKGIKTPRLKFLILNINFKFFKFFKFKI